MSKGVVGGDSVLTILVGISNGQQKTKIQLSGEWPGLQIMFGCIRKCHFRPQIDIKIKRCAYSGLYYAAPLLKTKITQSLINPKKNLKEESPCPKIYQSFLCFLKFIYCPFLYICDIYNDFSISNLLSWVSFKTLLLNTETLIYCD